MCGASSFEGGGADVRRGVDDREPGFGLARGAEDRGEPVRLGGRDHGRIGLAQLAPLRGGALGVEVDEHGGAAGRFGCGGDGTSERRLSGSALLAEEGHDQHG